MDCEGMEGGARRGEGVANIQIQDQGLLFPVEKSEKKEKGARNSV